MRRKSGFSISRKYKICVAVFALIIGISGITYNRDAEAREPSSSVTQEELELVFGKQNIKTVDIFSRGSDILNNQVVDIVPIDAKPIRPNYDLKLSQQNQDLIWELCAKNNLSYELALAVFHYESKFNLKAIGKNKNGSTDQGISQLNNRYTNTYKEYAIKYSDFPENQVFNVFNADHSIRAGIGTMVYLRNFWEKKGVPNELMIEYLTGSFNLGIEGFKKYVKQTGRIEREYSRQIHLRKDKLKNSNTLT